MTNATEDMLYRRVPPSKVSRDKQRQKEWQIKADLKEVAIESEFYREENSELLNSIDQQNPCSPVSNLGTSEALAPQASNIESTTVSDQPSNIQSTISTEPAVGDHDNMQQCDLGSIAGDSPSPSDTSVEDKQTMGRVVHCYLVTNEETSGDFDCDSCGNSITNNEWFRCTNCPDFDMCSSCWEDNKHKHHNKQIHKFTDYDCNSNIYCDSCGVVFEEVNESHVFCCSKCEDYALCLQCNKEGTHIIHKKNLQRITVAEYKMTVK
jgi:hypothetical protein